MKSESVWAEGSEKPAPDRGKEIVVLGSGFAGLWAALGATRRLDELDVAPGAQSG